MRPASISASPRSSADGNVCPLSTRSTDSDRPVAGSDTLIGTIIQAFFHPIPRRPAMPRPTPEELQAAKGRKPQEQERLQEEEAAAKQREEDERTRRHEQAQEQLTVAGRRRERCTALASSCRSEERRAGKECRFRWSPYH